MEFERNSVWIGDTGASCHMTHVFKGFQKVREGKSKAGFAVHGDEVETKTVSKWKDRHYRTMGKGQFEKGKMIESENVMFIPN